MATNTGKRQTVDSTHPTYCDAEDEWRTIEDLCQGPRRVKQVGERYLPKLKGQEQDEYRAYKLRATFVNFVKRTREALVGMLMRKGPKIEVPSEIEELTADVTLAGHTVKDWTRMVAEQAVSTGRSLTLIDWSEELERPYFSHYPAREVLNWASSREDGQEVLKLLVVRETDEVLDGHNVDNEICIRRYYIDEDGFLVVEKWIGQTTESDGQGSATAGKGETASFNLEETFMPSRRGTRLTRIPAVFHNATHMGPEIGEAPLYDIAEINTSHYRTSADLEHGRHICGLPTPYATGVSDTGALKLGSSTAWTAAEPDASFGFLEFTGQGLKALTDAIEEKEKQMAILGARLLYNESKDAEAFETVQIRANSETAALSNISGHLSATCTQALQWLEWWASATLQQPSDGKSSLIMNKDFMSQSMNPQMLTALTSALTTGSISVEAYYHQLEKGEIYPDEWDLEKEVAAIAERPVTTAPEPTPPNPVPPAEDE